MPLLSGLNSPNFITFFDFDYQSIYFCLCPARFPKPCRYVSLDSNTYKVKKDLAGKSAI
jgi:hypothetical protein